MTPTTPKPYRDLPSQPRSAPERLAQDTLQLLRAGSGFLAAGIVAILLIDLVFGGLSRHGPHTNGGWAMLVLALACLPLGLLLLLLGGAKWLGKRPR